MRNKPPLSILAILLLLGLGQVWAQQQARLKAVLFYPGLCASCEAVIDDYLMPLSIQRADSLELYPVDISEPPGAAVYRGLLQRFGERADAWKVPTLLLGDQLLRGKTAIEQGLPRLLGSPPAGATQWPEIPGLEALISGIDVAPASPRKGADGGIDIATTLAWGVLSALLISLGLAARRLTDHRERLSRPARIDSGWLPLLASLGLAIGAYLSYVAFSHSELMCGPVGDCASVQASPYAKLFGLPMASWGIVYYLSIWLLWLGQRRAAWQRPASLLLLAASLFGAAFSIYLTSLELFVIHAVCVWCLGSALLTLLIMLLVSWRLTAPRPALDQGLRGSM